jgi:hypothetical protein
MDLVICLRRALQLKLFIRLKETHINDLQKLTDNHCV